MLTIPTLWAHTSLVTQGGCWAVFAITSPNTSTSVASVDPDQGNDAQPRSRVSVKTVGATSSVVATKPTNVCVCGGVRAWVCVRFGGLELPQSS